MAKCSAPDCESPVHAKGFCRPHYKCFNRIGKPIPDRVTIHGSIEKKFALKSKGRNDAGCWIWTGGLDKDGYGSLRDGQKMKRAHRVSWEIHFGQIPEGMAILHKCNNPACVNPDHLKIGDHTDNMEDRKKNGRPWHSQAFRRKLGEKMKGRKITWGATIAEAVRKLTKEQAGEVLSRIQNGERIGDLANELGMHRTSVSKIKAGTYFG
jgi:hypothetical protein